MGGPYTRSRSASVHKYICGMLVQRPAIIYGNGLVISLELGVPRLGLKAPSSELYVMGPVSWIPSPGLCPLECKPRIPDTKHRIPSVAPRPWAWNLGLESYVLASGICVQGPESTVSRVHGPEPGSWLLRLGSWVLGPTRCTILDPGSWVQEERERASFPLRRWYNTHRAHAVQFFIERQQSPASQGRQMAGSPLSMPSIRLCVGLCSTDFASGCAALV